jgi:hypothetical protein
MKVRGSQHAAIPLGAGKGGGGRLDRASIDRGHLLMLRAAWSAARANVRQQFLIEAFAGICRDERPTWRNSSPGDRARDDALGTFLAGNVIESARLRVQSSTLLDCLNAWCLANELPPWTSVKLARELLRRGYVREKSHFIWWLGMDLKRASSDPPSPAPLPPEGRAANPRKKR